jgi:cobalt-zinc-cadmium resistance protein CzcA
MRMDDIVQGIVLMRRGEQSMPTIKRGARSRAHQQCEHPAAGVRIERIYDRKDPTLHHDQDRPAQYGVRHRADFPAAMDVPGQPAQRADRRRDHTFALFFAVGSSCRAGESANLLGGRDRLRLIVDATVIMVERHLPPPR